MRGIGVVAWIAQYTTQKASLEASRVLRFSDLPVSSPSRVFKRATRESHIPPNPFLVRRSCIGMALKLSQTATPAPMSGRRDALHPLLYDCQTGYPRFRHQVFGCFVQGRTLKIPEHLFTARCSPPLCYQPRNSSHGSQTSSVYIQFPGLPQRCYSQLFKYRYGVQHERLFPSTFPTSL